MDKLKDKIFNSFEEASKFKPKINFYNKQSYNRVRGSREIFNFYVYFDKKLVKYDAVYRSENPDYVATENDPLSPSGVDIQYDYYGGKNFDIYSLEKEFEGSEQQTFTKNSTTMNGKIYEWPKLPSGLYIVSHEEYIKRLNEYKEELKEEGKNPTKGKFLVEYPKSNSFYKADIPNTEVNYVSIAYDYFQKYPYYYATENLSNDKEDGRYYWSHFGTHDPLILLASEAKPLNDTINEIEDNVSKAAEEVAESVKNAIDYTVKTGEEIITTAGDAAGKVLESAGNAVGNGLSGLGGLLDDFIPLAVLAVIGLGIVGAIIIIR